jgi:hypothetical protein
MDWTGQPEPDFAWVVETGEFFRKWGEVLLRNPVKPRAVVVTDFNQRAALQAYPHISSSHAVLPKVFDALHRLGIDVDAINTQDAAIPASSSRMIWRSLPRIRRHAHQAALPFPNSTNSHVC